jgi:hypothetical protein
LIISSEHIISRQGCLLLFSPESVKMAELLPSTEPLIPFSTMEFTLMKNGRSAWWAWLLPVVAIVFAQLACGLPGAAQEAGGAAEPVEQTSVPIPTRSAEETGDEVTDEVEANTDSDDPAFGFKQSLLLALTPPRVYEALAGYMGDSFEIMIWYGNGEQMAPAEAVDALQSIFLPPGNELTFEDIEAVTPYLGGSPFLLYPQAADFLVARGWGEAGEDEALLYIAQDPEGGYYWSGMLYANGGFAANPLPGSGAGWGPLPAGICQDLRDSTAAALGVEAVTLNESAPFEDYLSGTSGTGCLITATGTGEDFTSYVDVYARLEEMLAMQGWASDMQYDAGGPTGQAGGFRRDSGLVLLSVGWEPSDDADCPSDQPISECSLAPEQQIYTITLAAAMQ